MLGNDKPARFFGCACSDLQDVCVFPKLLSFVKINTEFGLIGNAFSRIVFKIHID